MERAVHLIKRLFVYVIGLFILSLGISLAIKSNLGISPVSASQYILSLAAPMNIGLATVIIYGGFIVIQMLLFGKHYPLKELLQVFSSLFFGLFMTLAMMIIGLVPAAESYLMQLIYCLVSILFTATGVFLYISADILSLPPDGIMLGIIFRFKIDVQYAKLICDISLLTISVLASLYFLGNLSAFREGTILMALLTGYAIKFIAYISKERLQAFLGSQEKQKI